MTNQNTDINDLNFEQAINELEEIVSELESGEAGLDKAMEFYARGQLLKEHCNQKLKAAQLQVERINIESDGNINLLSFDEDK